MIDRLCSLDSQSYVDTLSNLALIEGLDGWSALEAITHGALPGGMLPLLFHEVTHHWTLSSPVGTALSLAKISAAWAMFGGKSAPGCVSPGDYAKYLAGGTFLRSWSEGLAQFAEFDVTAGSARSATFATQVICWLYYLGDAARKDLPPWQAVNEQLGMVRATRPMIERKANALRQPFTARAGGYLPGYLAVKCLASRLRAAGGPFEDPDFVLGYLRLFVFNDPAVVQMFLDRDGMVFVADYFDHLGRRFAELLERGDEELRRAGDELDEFLTSHSLDDIEGRFFPGLFVESSQYSGAFLALLKRQEQLGVLNESPGAAPGPENVLERFYRAIAFQRALLCLASSSIAASELRDARLTTGEPVILARTPERNTFVLAHWNRERYVDLDAIEAHEIDPASPRGIDVPGLRLEVWIDPVHTRAFVCVHSGSGARVGIRSLGGPCRSEDLPWDAVPRDDAVQVIDQIDRALPDAPIRAGEGVPATTLGQATAALHERIVTDVDAIMAWLAFPPSSGERIAPMLATKGLGALPSYRPDALRGLALLTLAAVAGRPAEDVCNMVHLPRSCLDQAHGLIRDMERLGWPARSGDAWSI